MSNHLGDWSVVPTKVSREAANTTSAVDRTWATNSNSADFKAFGLDDFHVGANKFTKFDESFFLLGSLNKLHRERMADCSFFVNKCALD